MLIQMKMIQDSLQPVQVGTQYQIAAVESTPAVADAVNTTLSYTPSRLIGFTKSNVIDDVVTSSPKSCVPVLRTPTFYKTLHLARQENG
jgi:hypothetical protein